MTEIFSLAGKSVLVTGATSGIGRQIAIDAARAGARVTLSGRNEQRMAEVLSNMSASNHESFLMDLSQASDIDEAINKMTNFDALVFNAGTLKTIPVRFVKQEDIDQLFQVNFNSIVILVQKLLKAKKINDGAAIVMISSASTLKFTLGNSMYAATKAALNAYTRALALELAPKRIRVNAVLPGMIETNILQNSSIGESELELHKKNYPLGRFGNPTDVSNLVHFLMSDASSWMTGSQIVLDGGYTLK